MRPVPYSCGVLQFAHMSRTLDQTLEVETPEQVVLTYTVAGVGSRAAAAIIDTAIIIVAWLLFGAMLSWAAREFGSTSDALRAPWLTSLGLLGQFLLQWGYYVLFEALADGQTPGKRRMRLRVVRDGGFAVDFGASAVRNLVRIVDQQPLVFYFFGMASVVFSRSGKRLGDFAAGTIVVQERAIRVSERVVDVEATDIPGAVSGTTADTDARTGEAGGAAAAVRAGVNARAENGGGPVILPQLPDDLTALLERFVARAPELEAGRRIALAASLMARVRAVLPNETVMVEPDLLRILARERQARSSGAAVSVDAAPGREERAIVAGGMQRWQRFGARLQTIQARGGLSSIPEEDLSDFVAEYRDVSADLARMRTASRGRTPDEMYYLGRLVAAGHNLLYRRRALPLHEILRFLFTTAPAEVWRSWRPIALAALLLFGPMAVAFARVKAEEPTGWASLISDGMRQRVEEALDRPLEGRAYLPEREARARGPVLASGITTNNVQVGYVAFAGGVLAGIPTVASMMFNGVSIGAVLGYYSKHGIARQIMGFIAAHGVLELFAICLAGGGGLLLAAAILIPGSRTRADAMVDNGRRAIVLIGAVTAILIVAGIIEGTISPNQWPDAAKYSVSALTAMGLVAWLASGRRALREERSR